MKTKRQKRIESLKLAYERCLKEYHESEAEVIAEQSAEEGVLSV